MIGLLAFSKAGHDKREIFMIVAEDAEYVYLCDGKLRPLAHPKKKNKKHIQLIKQGYDQTIREKLLSGIKVRDEEIKRAIKIYKIKEVTNVKGGCD